MYNKVSVCMKHDTKCSLCYTLNFEWRREKPTVSVMTQFLLDWVVYPVMRTAIETHCAAAVPSIP